MAGDTRLRDIDGMSLSKKHGEPWTWTREGVTFTWDTSTEQHLVARDLKGMEKDLGYHRSLVSACRVSLEFLKEIHGNPEKTEGRVKEEEGGLYVPGT